MTTMLERSTQEAVILTPEELRLFAALVWITQHPEEHRQDHWGVRTSCGTAMCLAGHLVVQSGKSIDFTDAPNEDGVVTASNTRDGESIEALGHELIGGDIVEVDTREYGPEWFEGEDIRLDIRNLRDSSADDPIMEVGIFDGDHTLNDLWVLAEIKTQGRVKRPEWV